MSYVDEFKKITAMTKLADAFGKALSNMDTDSFNKLVFGDSGVPIIPTYSEMTSTPSVSSTPSDSSTLSYEEFLAGERTHIEDAKDKTLESIEAKRQEAHTAAEKERERSVVDARTSYQQNLAEYGAKAEALASMGLTGSGYSDYLNANAYAQQRSDIKAAKAVESAAKSEADSNANDLKLAAELSYEENLGKLGEKEQLYLKEKEDTYYSLFDSAKSGTYSAEEIRDIAIRKGLEETEAEYLAGVARQAVEQRQAKTAGNLTDVDNNTIDNLVGSDAITKEQGQEKRYENFKNAILYSFDDVSGSQIASAYDSENISRKQYEQLKELWNGEIIVSEAQFIKTDGTFMGSLDAEYHLKKIINNPLCSGELKTNLQNIYNSIYTITTGNVENKSGSVAEYEDPGNNFLVRVGNKNYTVESGGEVTDKKVIAAASHLFDGVYFSHRGKYYIKKDSRIFEIRKPPTKSEDYWGKFTSAFGGS